MPEPLSSRTTYQHCKYSHASKHMVYLYIKTDLEASLGVSSKKDNSKCMLSSATVDSKINENRCKQTLASLPCFEA